MSAPTKRSAARGIVIAFPFAVALWVLAFLLGARACHGQVASTVQIVRGQATTLIRNPSPAALAVTVELRSRLLVNGAVVVGGSVRAIVSPAAFTLLPGGEQVVRVKLKEAVPVGTVLAFVATLVPLEDARPAPQSETTATAKITLITRIVSKAVVQ